MPGDFPHNAPSSISECDHVFTYPAELTIIRNLREDILALEQHKHFQQDLIDSLLIIITELMTNAIKHGSQNITNAHVSLGISFKKPHITCIIEDNGPGFDRSAIPDPTLPEYIHRDHGRGLFITEHLAKHIRYEYDKDTMRIIVTLEQY